MSEFKNVHRHFKEEKVLSTKLYKKKLIKMHTKIKKKIISPK